MRRQSGKFLAVTADNMDASCKDAMKRNRARAFCQDLDTPASRNRRVSDVVSC